MDCVVQDPNYRIMKLSFLLLLTSVVWGGLTTFYYGQLADLSTLVIAMTGIQVAVTGMLAELINRRVPNVMRHVEKEDES